MKRILLTFAALFAVVPPAGAAPRRQLRVCSDPNNMPFSNERSEGFENKLATLLARVLDADLVYTWAPQRRGFVRTTLKANRCDVVMGVPSALDMLRTTKPYYRSGYVFVTPAGKPTIGSLDSPELRSMKIGVPMVGDDGANPPPALALAKRNLIQNMRGYSVFGDYRAESPPANLIRALRSGEVDVALAWGPLAGWYAAHPEPKLGVRPMPDSEAPDGMSFSFDISLGVRKGDAELAAELDRALVQHRSEVDKILKDFDVPRRP